jgi:hypothetical protein
MKESGAVIMAFKGFLFLVFALALPQACGVATIRWAWRQQRRITVIPALIVAPAVYFATAYIFWGIQVKAIKEQGDRACGALGAAASLSTVGGTVIHFMLSCVVLLVIWYIAREQSR